ncbi:MAG: SDR family oxidoreductase [Proteobacteria bacterium]|nr:SDR family oxidoreductase [Pseudomonadota bacterium]
MQSTKKTILITGCSTGIGRALAIEFHRLGHHVYATARKPETLTDLGQMGMTTLKLDVNDPEDIRAAVSEIDKNGSLDILINNAGFIAMGPLSEIPLDRLRLQFETNVVSIIAMTQAFVPMMVRQKSGSIVTMGSVSGILPSPFAGAYCASKSAVHALSDVLRAELSPFGIRVITIQPGGIVSDLGKTAHQGIPAMEPNSIFAPIAHAIEARALASQDKATPVELFARKVASELLKNNPKPIIRLGNQSTILPFIRNYLPTRFRDRILIRKFSLDVLNKGKDS